MQPRGPMENPSDSYRSSVERSRRPLESGEPRRRHKGRHKAEYVATIVVNVALIYIANNLLNWGVPFLTRSFVVPLWLINLSLSATVAANAIFLIYDAGWFYRGCGPASMSSRSFRPMSSSAYSRSTWRRPGTSWRGLS